MLSSMNKFYLTERGCEGVYDQGIREDWGVLQDELRSMEGRRFNEEEKVDGLGMMHERGFNGG